MATTANTSTFELFLPHKIYLWQIMIYCFCIMEKVLVQCLCLNHSLVRNPNWARLIRKVLLANNKLGFIDGTLILNSPLVKIPSAIQAWIHSNKTVGTWIINSVSPRIILFNWLKFVYVVCLGFVLANLTTFSCE